MKVYISMLAVVLTAAFACTREELDSIVETTPTIEENNGHVLVPFTAEAAEPQTKVAMSGSTSNIVFSAGDKLMVYCFQTLETSLLTLKSGAGEKSAVFEGNLILASGKTEADLAGKKLHAVLIPEAGAMMGIFTYKAMFGQLTVDYSSGSIDSNLDALVARTILYEGETKYEDRKFTFKMMNSYVKMNVTVPSEESDLARNYRVTVTNDWHICSNATCNRVGWSTGTYSSTVSGSFTASSATGGTVYMAVLADDQVRITDDGALYDEVDLSIAMDNDYKEYDLQGGTITKAVIPPGKGITKSVTLTDNPDQDVLLGQPESVRNRIMSTYHADKNSNGYLSKYEAAQVKSCKMYGNEDLTDASFYGYFKGMTTFEEETLVSCDNMTKVILPKYITEIGNSAFKGCSKLGSVIIPSGVTSLGDRAFCNCTDLSRIVIPSGVMTIGEYAFKYCVDMTEVVFESPVKVTSIGASAFSECTSLESFAVPNLVETIENNTFEKCLSLAQVSIPLNVTKIGDYAFKNCDALTEVRVPAQVTSIGKFAFSSINSLKTIFLPTVGLSSIEEETFSYCPSLVNITLPADVKTIDTRAFKGCTSLVEIKIPGEVTYIGYEAFYDCQSLTTVYCYPAIPPNVTYETFGHCPNLTTIYVPDKDAYWVAHATWSQWWWNIIKQMP